MSTDPYTLAARMSVINAFDDLTDAMGLGELVETSNLLDESATDYEFDTAAERLETELKTIRDQLREQWGLTPDAA